MTRNTLLLLAFFFLPLSVFSSNTDSIVYKNLIFEGGGLRGLVYCGAIIELEHQGVLKNIERVCGTSSGAIYAMLLALGYNSEEIKKITYNTNIRKFNDNRFLFIGGIKRLKNNYGWYRGEVIKKYFHRLIENKTGNGDITLKELHENKAEYGNKDLYVIATCLNHQKEIIISHETFPMMKVKDAVRASMSIPLYYKAVVINNSGLEIKKYNKIDSLHLLVDGGLTINFPLHIFDDEKYLTPHKVDKNSTEKNIIYNYETLGLIIETDEQIEYDKLNKGLAPHTISNFKDYIIAFYNLTLETLNKKHLTQKDWNRIILLSATDIGPKPKGIPDKDKDKLINSGIQGVKNFLNHMYELPEQTPNP